VPIIVESSCSLCGFAQPLRARLWVRTSLQRSISVSAGAFIALERQQMTMLGFTRIRFIQLGSSREHAPWAIKDMGISCLVSTSFADIFMSNCFKNGRCIVFGGYCERSLKQKASSWFGAALLVYSLLLDFTMRVLRTREPPIIWSRAIRREKGDFNKIFFFFFMCVQGNRMDCRSLRHPLVLLSKSHSPPCTTSHLRFSDGDPFIPFIVCIQLFCFPATSFSILFGPLSYCSLGLCVFDGFCFCFCSKMPFLGVFIRTQRTRNAASKITSARAESFFAVAAALYIVWG
jgi:hypothetical protein